MVLQRDHQPCNFQPRRVGPEESPQPGLFPEDPGDLADGVGEQAGKGGQDVAGDRAGG